MKPFFKKYLRQVLVFTALIFFGGLAAYFLWGIATISVDINRAVNPNRDTSGAASFDLKGAASLNLKGLVQK
jgi:hypothetical protein